MTDTPDHFVLICSTCQGPIPADIAKAVLDAALPARYETRLIRCMAGCARPMTVGVQAVGKAQYLFGDIETQADLKAVVAFAHQFGDCADGWTSASDRPPALFYKTLSRMPRLPVGGKA